MLSTAKLLYNATPMKCQKWLKTVNGFDLNFAVLVHAFCPLGVLGSPAMVAIYNMSAEHAYQSGPKHNINCFINPLGVEGSPNVCHSGSGGKVAM